MYKLLRYNEKTQDYKTKDLSVQKSKIHGTLYVRTNVCTYVSTYTYVYIYRIGIENLNSKSGLTYNFIGSVTQNFLRIYDISNADNGTLLCTQIGIQYINLSRVLMRHMLF